MNWLNCMQNFSKIEQLFIKEYYFDGKLQKDKILLKKQKHKMLFFPGSRPIGF